MIRAAAATATPRTDEPTSSTSAVCTPARISRLSGRTAVPDRQCAANCPRGSVEHCEDAITGSVDDSSACVVDAESHEFVMPLDEIGPGSIAELGRLGRRPDDVGEEQRREDAIGVVCDVSRTQHELLDGGQHGLRVADEREVVAPWSARCRRRRGSAPQGSDRAPDESRCSPPAPRRASAPESRAGPHVRRCLRAPGTARQRSRGWRRGAASEPTSAGSPRRRACSAPVGRGMLRDPRRQS